MTESSPKYYRNPYFIDLIFRPGHMKNSDFDPFLIYFWYIHYDVDWEWTKVQCRNRNISKNETYDLSSYGKSQYWSRFQSGSKLNFLSFETSLINHEFRKNKSMAFLVFARYLMWCTPLNKSVSYVLQFWSTLSDEQNYFRWGPSLWLYDATLFWLNQTKSTYMR